MLFLMGFILGVITGTLIFYFLKKTKLLGRLIVDRSTEDTLLFLEIEHAENIDDLKKHDVAAFEVVFKNFSQN